jgi:hypothetical protein
MRSIIIIVLSLFVLNLSAQPKFDNFEDANIYLNGIIGDSEWVKIYNSGYIIINTGSACSGRYMFKLQDITFSKEEKVIGNCGGEPSQTLVISFECKTSDCIFDPSMIEFGVSGSGVFLFSDIEKGKKLYNVLVQMQKLVD